MHLYFPLVTMLTLANSSNSAPLVTAIEGQRALQLPEGLNNVPMMGKKDASPRDVPSFTSGYLMPAYPQYMMNRQSKRDAEVPATWHLGKRAPWTLERSSWVDSLFKPSPSTSGQGKRSLSAWTSPWASNSLGKRSAIPNDWSSPWDHALRSPQGFRFNEAGHDLLTRDLVYKRTDESAKDLTKRNPEPILVDDSHQEQSQPTPEHEADYTENRSLMQDVSLVSVTPWIVKCVQYPYS